MVSVQTDEAALAGITVAVTPPSRGAAHPCAADDAPFRTVRCEEGPHSLKIGVSDANGPGAVPGGGDMPVLQGWSFDRDRGEVMALLYGVDSDENRRVVEEVLRDRLLGDRTTAGMNRAGRDIDGFGQLEVQARGQVSVAPPR